MGWTTTRTLPGRKHYDELQEQAEATPYGEKNYFLEEDAEYAADAPNKGRNALFDLLFPAEEK